MNEAEKEIESLEMFLKELKESGGKFWVSGNVKALHMCVVRNAIDLIKQQQSKIDKLEAQVRKYELEKGWEISPDRMGGGR